MCQTPPMPIDTVLVATDGSEPANRAVVTGLVKLQPARRIVVATVIDEEDPTLVTGTGMAGPVMSEEQFDDANEAMMAQGRSIMDALVEEIGAAGDGAQIETQLLRGRAGPALCALAEELGADVVVMGTRGRGGIKRAVLGSVSDHVVRHAPCSVLITG